jgi:hypothetical protein
MLQYKKLLLAGAAILLLPPSAPAQEVFKEISSQRLEDLLRGMNIQFTKGTGDKGTTFYDYKSKTVQLRLWNFNGKDLMIDVFLPKVEWEVVNNWNGRAKFSRARLNKDKQTGVESAVIESNLDLAGGVTEEAIKHFIRSFDLEVAGWANASVPAVAEEETFKSIPPERLEKILSGLNINFKKAQGKGNNVFFYDFERNNHKVRLTNFGGNDLMIDCLFQQVPLAKVNKWNLDRSFVRAVLYPGGGNPYAALESNLDCVGGTSESIIRFFITSFDGEVLAFDEYLKKG